MVVDANSDRAARFSGPFTITKLADSSGATRCVSMGFATCQPQLGICIVGNESPDR